MSSTDKFKGHGGRTADGIKVTASSTKTTFAAKRDNFKSTTKFAAVNSMTVIVIATMEHFVDIFKNGITDRDAAISNSIKMIVKNSL